MLSPTKFGVSEAVVAAEVGLIVSCRVAAQGISEAFLMMCIEAEGCQFKAN